MIYLLAGHDNKDPGASGKRTTVSLRPFDPFWLLKTPQKPSRDWHPPMAAEKPPWSEPFEVKTSVIDEATLTKELRDLIVQKFSLPQFQGLDLTFSTDDDDDNLKEVLSKIDSTEKDVICDLHFNSGTSKSTGVEVIYPKVPSLKEKNLATNLAARLSKTMGIANRGSKDETKTKPKKLGVMRKAGINILIEVCFISNPSDVAKYDANRDRVALDIAELLVEAHANNR